MDARSESDLFSSMLSIVHTGDIIEPGVFIVEDLKIGRVDSQKCIRFKKKMFGIIFWDGFNQIKYINVLIKFLNDTDLWSQKHLYIFTSYKGIAYHITRHPYLVK